MNDADGRIFGSVNSSGTCLLSWMVVVMVAVGNGCCGW